MNLLPNVLLLGCGRSGTSIAGELFEHFPPYSYRFEPILHGHDYAAQLAAWPRPWAAKVPKAPGDEADSFTPGLPFSLPRVLQAAGEPLVIIWVVRHPLDAICSLRPGIEAAWSHNPRPPHWQEMAQAPWEDRCAAHWHFINDHGYRAVADRARILRFEDIVADPVASAQRVAQWLGWDHALPSPVSLWIKSVSNQKGVDVYEAKHQSRWSEQNHAWRVGRHRENLSPEQAKRIWQLEASVAARFGYEGDTQHESRQDEP